MQLWGPGNNTTGAYLARHYRHSSRRQRRLPGRTLVAGRGPQGCSGGGVPSVRAGGADTSRPSPPSERTARSLGPPRAGQRRMRTRSLLTHPCLRSPRCARAGWPGSRTGHRHLPALPGAPGTAGHCRDTPLQGLDCVAGHRHRHFCDR